MTAFKGLRTALLAAAAFAAAQAWNAGPAIAAVCDNTSASDVSLTIGPPVTVPGTTYWASGCATTTTGVNAAEELTLATSVRSGLTLLDKSDSAGGNTITGILYTVTAPASPTGTWTLAWQDTNGGAVNNLPLTLDLVVVLKAATGAAAYLLNDVVLPANPLSGSGSFEITIAKNNSLPDLSHMSVYGADFRSSPAQDVPEPSTLALLGLGLAGIGVATRRRARRVA